MTTAAVRNLVAQAMAVKPQREPEEQPTCQPAAPPFERVPVADLLDAAPPAPMYWWDGLLPAGHVTLLGAHGGTGKSMLALMLACALVPGLPLFGIATRRARVAYFSAEDPASLVRHRLHLICRGMGLDPAELADRLHVLDATDGDPVLFREVSAGGTRQGVSTPTYWALSQYLDDHGVNVLIIDNASDVYDASEIERARVRAFMRTLAGMAQPDRAVLLLAHVDRGTSRGERTQDAGYSGSTAWHNSARSRLYLSRDKDGVLLLEHQKHNLGKLHEALRLAWPDGGLPELDRPVEGIVQAIATTNAARSLLRLVHEFTERGEYVSTATSGPSCMSVALRHADGYPKRMQAGEVIEAMRSAERRGLVERVDYVNASRKPRERWQVTPAGMLAAELAPVAPVAPVPPIGAIDATGKRPAPVAPVPGAGGCGGTNRRTGTGADDPETEAEGER